MITRFRFSYVKFSKNVDIDIFMHEDVENHSEKRAFVGSFDELFYFEEKLLKTIEYFGKLMDKYFLSSTSKCT